jgi:membrane AbrB-like protein
MARDEPALAATPPVPETPLPQPWSTRVRPVLLALGIGLVGALLFNALTLPLPFMLGPMAVVTAAALARVPLAMPQFLRRGTAPVLGVVLGSAFSPDVLARVSHWLVTASGLVLWLTLCTAGSYVWFRRVARYDRATAFFSSTPGGLAEMTLVGAQMGADVRVIPLVHSVRILIAVFTIPFWFRFTQELAPVSAAARIGIFEVPLLDYFVLASCAVVGVLVATRLRVPSAGLMGPLFFSAALHLTGVTHSRLPFLLVATAQIVIGTMVGARFVGFPARRVGGIAFHAAVTAAFVLGLTVVFAEVLSALTDFPIPGLVLAFSPGGLTEMSLMALALQVDTAFVAGHHALRVIVVTMIAPQIFRLIRWQRQRRTGETD